MKKLHSAMFMGILFACATTAFAVEPQAPATPSSQSRPMSVLVSVSDQGHVTKVRGAEKLPENVSKLLKGTIARWITKPAVVNGRHVASQVLLTVELRTKPTADGQQEAYFAYVSSEAVPARSDWKIVDGHVVYTGKEYVREERGIEPPRWESPSAPAPSGGSNPPGSAQGNGRS